MGSRYMYRQRKRIPVPSTPTLTVLPRTHTSLHVVHYRARINTISIHVPAITRAKSNLNHRLQAPAAPALRAARLSRQAPRPRAPTTVAERAAQVVSVWVVVCGGGVGGGGGGCGAGYEACCVVD